MLGTRMMAAMIGGITGSTIAEMMIGYHKCPYGCGRLIPNTYKGCTELLKDHPDYFK